MLLDRKLEDPHEFDSSIIKLIDFGAATKFESDKKLSYVIGTVDYIAPEGIIF